jgi:hypothetical protein
LGPGHPPLLKLSDAREGEAEGAHLKVGNSQSGMFQLRAEDEAVAKSLRASSYEVEDRLYEDGVQGELAIRAAEGGEAGRISLRPLQ